MSKKKLIVDQYNPQIYPFKLYVVKNFTVEQIKKLFDITDEELSGYWDALTIFGCKYKGEKDNCCVVLLSDEIVKQKDKFERIDTCSHEALHYVINTMTAIESPCSRSNSEPYCYLQGWATKCIYTTLCK